MKHLNRFGVWLPVSMFFAMSLPAAGPNVRLVDAVKNTDKAAIRSLLEQHADVNAPDVDGATALRWKPVGLFNKMIAPMLHYSVKGILWYQGESNTGRPDTYKKLFPVMISDWREKWKSNIPFLAWARYFPATKNGS